MNENTITFSLQGINEAITEKLNAIGFSYNTEVAGYLTNALFNIMLFNTNDYFTVTETADQTITILPAEDGKGIIEGDELEHIKTNIMNLYTLSLLYREIPTPSVYRVIFKVNGDKYLYFTGFEKSGDLLRLTFTDYGTYHGRFQIYTLTYNTTTYTYEIGQTLESIPMDEVFLKNIYDTNGGINDTSYLTKGEHYSIKVQYFFKTDIIAAMDGYGTCELYYSEDQQNWTLVESRGQVRDEDILSFDITNYVPESGRVFFKVHATNSGSSTEYDIFYIVNAAQGHLFVADENNFNSYDIHTASEFSFNYTLQSLAGKYGIYYRLTKDGDPKGSFEHPTDVIIHNYDLSVTDTLTLDLNDKSGIYWFEMYAQEERTFNRTNIVKLPLAIDCNEQIIFEPYEKAIIPGETVSDIYFRYYSTGSLSGPINLTLTLTQGNKNIINRDLEKIINSENYKHRISIGNLQQIETVLLSAGDASLTLSNPNNLEANLNLTVVDALAAYTISSRELLYSFEAEGLEDNSETNNKYSYKEIEAETTGINGSTNGYKRTENGVASLRLRGGAKHTVHMQPLGLQKRDSNHSGESDPDVAPEVNGRTIEIDLKFSHVNNALEECVTIGDSLIVTPTYCYCLADGQSCTFTTDHEELIENESNIACAYLAEDQKLHLTFVVEPLGHSSYSTGEDTVVAQRINIFINGEYANSVFYDTFSAITKELEITASSCQVDLYSIQIYNRALEPFEVLNNYLARGSMLDRIAAFDYNDVLTNGEVDYIKARGKYRCLLLEGELSKLKSVKIPCTILLTEPANNEAGYIELIKATGEHESDDALSLVPKVEDPLDPTTIGNNYYYSVTHNGNVLVEGIDGNWHLEHIHDVLTPEDPEWTAYVNAHWDSDFGPVYDRCAAYVEANNGMILDSRNAVQGTTSVKFPVKNLKIYPQHWDKKDEDYDKDEYPLKGYETDGQSSEPLSIEESKFCWKSDYMSTDHANTYNAVMADFLYVDDDTTVPETMDDYKHYFEGDDDKDKYQNTVWGYRCLLFQKPQNGTTEDIAFIGDGMLNNDKGNSKSFGLEVKGDTYPYKEEANPQKVGNIYKLVQEYNRDLDNEEYATKALAKKAYKKKYECTVNTTKRQKWEFASNTGDAVVFKSCKLEDIKDGLESTYPDQADLEAKGVTPDYSHIQTLFAWVVKRAPQFFKTKNGEPDWGNYKQLQNNDGFVVSGNVPSENISLIYSEAVKLFKNISLKQITVSGNIQYFPQSKEEGISQRRVLRSITQNTPVSGTLLDLCLTYGDPDTPELQLWYYENNQWQLFDINNLYTYEEQFKEEFEKHFNLGRTLIYYLLSDYVALSDNQAKNLFMQSMDIENKTVFTFDNNDEPVNPNWDNNNFAQWFPVLYDLDSCFGVENSSYMQIPYDSDMTYDKYNGRDSWLWNIVRNCFKKELIEKAQILNRYKGNKVGLNYDTLLDFHINHNRNLINGQKLQSPLRTECVCQRLVNADNENKYLKPFTDGWTDSYGNKFYIPDYMYILRGSREQQKRNFIKKRCNYINSKYQTDDFINNQITFRCGVPVAQTDAILYIKSSQAIKPYVKFGDAGGKISSESISNYKSDPVKIQAKDDIGQSDTVYISGGSLITELGNLSKFEPYEIQLWNAGALEKLLIGSTELKYNTTQQPDNQNDEYSKVSPTDAFKILQLNHYVHLTGDEVQDTDIPTDISDLEVVSGDVFTPIEHYFTIDGLSWLNHTGVSVTEWNDIISAVQGHLYVPSFFNLRGLNLQACRNLKELDIAGCQGLYGMLNVDQCEQLEKMVAYNTHITGVKLAPQAPINTLWLPTTLTNLEFRDFQELKDSNLLFGDSENNLTSLYDILDGQSYNNYFGSLKVVKIENCAHLGLKSYKFLSYAVRNNSEITTLHLTDVNWSFDNSNSNIINSVFNNLNTLAIKKENSEIDCNFSGEIHINLSDEYTPESNELLKIFTNFPNLRIYVYYTLKQVNHKKQYILYSFYDIDSKKIETIYQYNHNSNDNKMEEINNKIIGYIDMVGTKKTDNFIQPLVWIYKNGNDSANSDDCTWGDNTPNRLEDDGKYYIRFKDLDLKWYSYRLAGDNDYTFRWGDLISLHSLFFLNDTYKTWKLVNDSKSSICSLIPNVISSAIESGTVSSIKRQKYILRNGVYGFNDSEVLIGTYSDFVLGQDIRPQIRSKFNVISEDIPTDNITEADLTLIFNSYIAIPYVPSGYDNIIFTSDTTTTPARQYKRYFYNKYENAIYEWVKEDNLWKLKLIQDSLIISSNKAEEILSNNAEDYDYIMRTQYYFAPLFDYVLKNELAENSDLTGTYYKIPDTTLHTLKFDTSYNTTIQFTQEDKDYSIKSKIGAVKIFRNENNKPYYGDLISFNGLLDWELPLGFTYNYSSNSSNGFYKRKLTSAQEEYLQDIFDHDCWKCFKTDDDPIKFMYPQATTRTYEGELYVENWITPLANTNRRGITSLSDSLSFFIDTNDPTLNTFYSKFTGKVLQSPNTAIGCVILLLVKPSKDIQEAENED